MGLRSNPVGSSLLADDVGLAFQASRFADAVGLAFQASRSAAAVGSSLQASGGWLGPTGLVGLVLIRGRFVVALGHAFVTSAQVGPGLLDELVGVAGPAGRPALNEHFREGLPVFICEVSRSAEHVELRDLTGRKAVLVLW